MDFLGETPPGIRRGQSLRLRIELGQSSEELLLPVGGFYKDTGGNWVFVVEDGNRAVKRDIKLGRKMGSEYFEVLEGLKPGEKVIHRLMRNFGTNEVLLLNDNDSYVRRNNPVQLPDERVTFNRLRSIYNTTNSDQQTSKK